MRQPDLKDSFPLDGKEILVDWYDLNDRHEIPDILWQQVYVVGDLNGQVPVVYYANGNVGLPGGRTEQGESIDQTITREVREEINCELTDWVPIGYQTLHEAGQKDVNQLRVYGSLTKSGEFENDPGGGVIGYHLINLADLNKMLGWGISGQRLQDRAERLHQARSTKLR